MLGIYADVRNRAVSDFEFKWIFQVAVFITNNAISPLSLWERVRVRGRHTASHLTAAWPTP